MQRFFRGDTVMVTEGTGRTRKTSGGTFLTLVTDGRTREQLAQVRMTSGEVREVTPDTLSLVIAPDTHRTQETRPRRKPLWER